MSRALGISSEEEQQTTLTRVVVGQRGNYYLYSFIVGVGCRHVWAERGGATAGGVMVTLHGIISCSIVYLTEKIAIFIFLINHKIVYSPCFLNISFLES